MMFLAGDIGPWPFDATSENFVFVGFWPYWPAQINLWNSSH